MKHPAPRPARLVPAAVIALCLLFSAVALSACGGSSGGTADAETAAESSGSNSTGSAGASETSGSTESVDSSGSALQTAEAKVKEASAAPSGWTGPTSAPKPEGGKLIVMIDIAATTQSSGRLIAGFEAAGKALGWRTQVIDGEGDPAKMNAGFDTAIQEGADGIYLVAVEAPMVTEGLEKAKSAGIPVVSGSVGEPQPGVNFVVDAHYTQRGEDIAAAAVKDTGGEAKIGMFTLAEGTAIGDETEGTEKYLEENGGGEIVASTDFIITDIGTPALGQKAIAFLQANPEINALWVAWDSPAAGIIPALKAAGIEVPVYSFEGDTQDLDFIREGELQKADGAAPLEWVSWGAMDALNRLFDGEKTVDEGIPIKLLTKENLPPKGQPWTGEYDYASEYEKLWGVG
ncbi:MAG TPA: sugar ABC transporter substrate-binding protein [Solirubrobacterales bacterium]